MRFAFISVTTGIVWGGSEELWSLAALRLAQSGHSVHVATCGQAYGDHPPPRLAALRAAGASIRPPASAQPARPIARIAGALGRHIRQALDTITLEAEEIRWLRAAQPELVVVSSGGNGFLSNWLKAIVALELPYVLVAQAADDAYWPGEPEAALQRQWYAGALRAFFVSEANLRTTSRQYELSTDSFEVVANPRNVTGELIPWPATNDRLRLAYVGRLEPSAKGCDVLLRAWAQPRWRERTVDLHLYGAGVHADGMRRLARQLDVPVTFHGQVADIRQVWTENHMLVLPSRFEGLPLALVEAMWCGRPAVVTDVGGNAEAIVDKVSGFVAAAPTLSLLSDTLERAWHARESWEAMGRAARIAAVAKFPADPVAAFTDQLLRMSA